jgi:hypothetical protein
VDEEWRDIERESVRGREKERREEGGEGKREGKGT